MLFELVSGERARKGELVILLELIVRERAMKGKAV